MVKNDTFIIRPEWFGAYGLDADKNFMESPECPCGCGGIVSVLLDTPDDVEDFAAGVLSENECCHCAIFAHSISNKMYAFIKVMEKDNGLKLMSFTIDTNDFSFFKAVDEEFEFHCYGLIIETQPGKWHIVEK